MNFVFIRHSKTHPTPDIPIKLWGLTEEGTKKAKALATNPIIKDLSLIYSSLQTKALETALVLAKPNNIPIKTNPDLTEVTSFTREFLGDSYKQAVTDFFSGKISRIAHGETISEALSRFEDALNEIAESESTKENIGVVSHGTILSFFSAKYSSKPAIFYHDNIQMPDFAVFNWDTKKFVKEWEGVLEND